jgi:hypothetical protein
MEQFYLTIALLNKAWYEVEYLARFTDRDKPSDLSEKILMRMSGLNCQIEKRLGIEGYNARGFKWQEEVNKLIRIVEMELVKADEAGRQFLFRRLIRRIHIFNAYYDEQFYAVKFTDGKIERVEKPRKESFKEHYFSPRIDVGQDEEGNRDYYYFVFHTHCILREVAKDICILCYDLGWDMEEMSPLILADEYLNRNFNYPILDDVNPTAEVSRKVNYETIPRNQLIPAVCALLDKAGINQGNTSKMAIAKFAEALTGGNIEQTSQNNYARRYLDEPLTPKVKEMFKEIGLEV